MAVLTSQMGWMLILLSLPLALFGSGGLPLGTVALLLAAPPVALVLQLAIMRSRELAADLDAAELTGDPAGLATALRRIEVTNRSLLGMILPLPLPEEPGMARTHPATTERVRRLEKLAHAPTRDRPGATSRACA